MSRGEAARWTAGATAPPPEALGLQTVTVAGIGIADSSVAETIAALTEPRARPVLGFALHVGGLNAASSPAVTDAYAAGDLTYADGVAAYALARLAGAASIERAPTTDLGPLLIEALRSGGRRRLFLLGGPPGLADAAARRLADAHAVTVVGTMNGYAADPSAFLAAVRRTRPDLVFVGLGAPKEMCFLAALRASLPPALYITCGGWFGFLVGDEERAPAAMRRWGLEWAWRVAHQPGRLAPRYARGVWTTVRLATQLACDRLRRADHRATEGPVPTAAMDDCGEQGVSDRVGPVS
jgi:N-acetylglucosaminyldiphosphoundecaprenol N-acetyl-beta-D-mannosaminyltransferase